MVDKEDRDLINGLRDNKAKYQWLLVNKYAGLLLAITMRCGLSREDAQEVVNDTFYKAVKNIDGFDVNRGAKFSTWLVRIAINTARDKYRQITKQPVTHSIEDRVDRGIQDTQALWQEPQVQDSESGLLSKKILKEALEALSYIDRKILMERACGQQHKEIGILLDKTENAVKVAHHRALKRLKQKYLDLLEELEDNSKAIALKAFLNIEDIHEETTN